jgi:hypothetical protein
MKKHLLRSVVVGLFALSASTVGAVFTKTSATGPLLACSGSCSAGSLNCLSPCVCQIDSGTYFCAKPSD